MRVRDILKVFTIYNSEQLRVLFSMEGPFLLLIYYYTTHKSVFIFKNTQKKLIFRKVTDKLSTTSHLQHVKNMNQISFTPASVSPKMLLHLCDLI